MRNKQTKRLAITIIIALIILLGGTYAWLTLNLNSTKNNSLRAGSLDLVLDDTTSNGINLSDTVPMSDAKGLMTKAYTFTLTNNGNQSSNYTIYLDDLDLNSNEIRMQDKYIKYNLTKNDEENTPMLLAETGGTPNRILESGTIERKTTNSYTLRIWIDSEADNAVMGTIFYGKLRIEAEQNTASVIPTCEFTNLSYIGVGQEAEMELNCTSSVGIIEKQLTTSDLTVNNEEQIEIKSVSTPEKIVNGYKYKIILLGKKEGSSDLILNSGTIKNTNNQANKKLERTITTTSLVPEQKEVTLDLSDNTTSNIKLTGENIGSLTYISSNPEVASVADNGQITGLSVGETIITIKESNQNTETSVKVSVEKTLSVAFKNNGNGIKSISKESDSCKLTKDNKASCMVSIPTTIMDDGYTMLGWNTNKDATTSETEEKIALTSNNITYYSISKKDAITLTATFMLNGASKQTDSFGVAVTSESVTRTCILNEAYNKTIQNSSCNITSPIITSSDITPTIKGYSTTSNDHSSTWSSNTSKTISTNVTYYAQTYKDKIKRTATFLSNGATSISTTSISCEINAIYNGNNGVVQATSCTPATNSPIITRDGYKIVGWNTSKDATTSNLNINTQKELSADITYYAITYKRNTINWNGNGATSEASSSYCDQYNTTTVCSITSPKITRSGFEIKGWNTNKDASTSSWNQSVTKTNINSSTTYYAISSKEIAITWLANGATTIGSNKSTCTISNAATACSITSPTITKSNSTVIGWNTSSTAKTSLWDTSKTRNDVNESDEYYAITVDYSLFDYKTSVQTFTTPITGQYEVHLWGAAGGSTVGGKGGYTEGVINLTAGRELYLHVGNKPSSAATAGYNGGGAATNSDGRYYSGGGATSISLYKAEWNNTYTLASRIMVAAGGGGGFYSSTSQKVSGGAAGGLIGSSGSRATFGSDSVTCISKLAGGGTQSAGGAAGVGELSGNAGLLGIGGTGASYQAGGGGGYYGGGSSAVCQTVSGSGAGGSSYINGFSGCTQSNSTFLFTSGKMSSGNQSMPTRGQLVNTTTGNDGNGYALIKYIKP